MADELILASGSRFRKAMLEKAGIKFRVVPADVDEDALKAAMLDDDPDIEAALVAENLAIAKAEHHALLDAARWLAANSNRDTGGSDRESLRDGSDDDIATRPALGSRPWVAVARRETCIGLTSAPGRSLAPSPLPLRVPRVLWLAAFVRTRMNNLRCRLASPPDVSGRTTTTQSRDSSDWPPEETIRSRLGRHPAELHTMRCLSRR